METIRRVKPFYELYNLFHYKRLKHQVQLYKKHGLKRSFYRSLSSIHLPEDSLDGHPWLDKFDSVEVLPRHSSFGKLNSETQESLVNWSSNGYAILKGFFSEEKVTAINGLVEELLKDKRMPVKDGCKIMYAVRYSNDLEKLVNNQKLNEVLDLLMGRKADLFQSVNFLNGSEDSVHSDFIHMSTYPYGYLLAVWIALEDITLENGPLYYYPGSHKLSYVMNGDFDHGGNRWLLGKNCKRKYAEAIERKVEEHQFEKKFFTASKGDVLIWHANLLHGGSKVQDVSKTRKSMVLHYFGEDVIRYHEITQRPSFESM